MIITSWIQSPSWIIWAHYLTTSPQRNHPASASLPCLRCCCSGVRSVLQPLMQKWSPNCRQTAGNAQRWLHTRNPLSRTSIRCAWTKHGSRSRWGATDVSQLHATITDSHRALDGTNINLDDTLMGRSVLARRWTKCSLIRARKTRSKVRPEHWLHCVGREEGRYRSSNEGEKNKEISTWDRGWPWFFKMGLQFIYFFLNVTPD